MLIAISLALSRPSMHCKIVDPKGGGGLVHRMVASFYTPAFTANHCTKKWPD